MGAVEEEKGRFAGGERFVGTASTEFGDRGSVGRGGRRGQDLRRGRGKVLIKRRERERRTKTRRTEPTGTNFPKNERTLDFGDSTSEEIGEEVAIARERES